MTESTRNKKNILRDLNVKLGNIQSKYQKYILIFFGLFLYSQLYPSLIENTIIQKTATYFTIQSSNTADIIFFIISIYPLFLYIILLQKWSLYNLKLLDFFPPLILCVLYCLHRSGLIGNTEISFTPFKSIHLLRYFDPIFLLLLRYSFVPTSKVESNKSHIIVPQLIEDNLASRSNKDVFKRNGYAEYIATLILNQNSKSKSFAIGIKGSWGSGKSVFLSQIECKITAGIKIKFNPWLCESSDKIVSDFFKVLINETAQLDSGLSKLLKRYYTSLKDIDENYGGKMLTSLGFFKRSEALSLEEQQNDIVEKLNETNIKIVVFIDDLDRLNSEEILAVLKLIRNSFNFPNTYFLIAYDEKYIIDTLKDSIENPNKFLEKIFQLDIDLPGFPLFIVQNELRDMLCDEKTEVQKEIIKQAFQYINKTSIIKQNIINLRDAIRFTNSFNHIYQKKENEIDYIDFMLLEILKLKFRSIYEEVRLSLIAYTKNEYLKIPNLAFDNESCIKFDIGTYSLIVEGNEASPFNSNSIEVMEHLFNRKENFDPVKSIRITGNSIRYFSDDLYGEIPISDFEKYKELSFNIFKDLIDTQFERGNVDEIANKILRVNGFTNPTEFFNLNKGLLYICNLKNKSNYIPFVIKSFIENYENLQDKLRNDFLSVFQQLFNGDYQSPFAECEALAQIIELNNDSNVKDVSAFDYLKKICANILVSNLKDYIKKNSNFFSEKSHKIYNYIIKLNPEVFSIEIADANSQIQGYSLNNQSTFFKPWLIKPFFSSGSAELFNLDLLVKEYWSMDEFERRLSMQESSIDVLVLQYFLKKYKKNNYLPTVYIPGTLEINSDEQTTFEGSDSYSQLPRSYGVIRYQKEKIEASANHKVFENSYWISHAQEVSMDEAIYGGIYSFERIFNLRGIKEIVSANLYCLVDDFIKIKVNDKDAGDENSGINLPNPIAINIGDLLNLEENKIKFIVRNDNAKGWANAIERPEDNPYDFIYTLRIEFKM
ncbi:KAP family P-loop NTPase fold protein [Ferruginibacter sp. SUN106]|uniref:KAP family P-loop NTPase fold protein n=1 Tax=Ferruginibacter sp. SUN106 TaxID=2978348 RepID=UPI003D3646B8